MKISESCKKKSIYVLALGGTISSVAENSTDEFYHTASIDIQELVTHLDIDRNRIEIICEQLLKKISHEITDDDLIAITNRINTLLLLDNVDGIVVTQGTNCLEETAYFVSLVVNSNKNIVFTGSFKATNNLGYDGYRNLYNAIFLASQETLYGNGVLITFNDCIVNARDAVKNNPSLSNDFSNNGIGIMGYVQGKIAHIHNKPNFKHTQFSEFCISRILEFPKIYIIYAHMGQDSLFVEAAIASGAKGIISAGFGKGYQTKKVTQVLEKASNNGVFVIRCSRTGQGIINRQTNIDDKYGFIAAGSLNPQKARILLAVALSVTVNKNEIQRIFDQY